MSLEAALNLSVPELLRALNEKLGLECTRARGIRLPPVPASITSLEAEIESLVARTHEILELIPSLRNLLRPANRLPPETLSQIALFVSLDSTDSKPIVPLTHVCRYWRESIVSTPGNWTLISSGSIRLTELSLERCQAAPLNLWLTMDQVRGSPRFIALIMPYTKNVETLHIRGIWTIGELVQALPDFPQSMPNLRSLVLACNPELPDRLEVASADPLGQPISPLTHLSLWFIPLYPSLRRLTTLTNLSIHNHPFDLHLDTILDFLEANRALQHVNLNLQLAQPAFQNARRRVGIMNNLQDLSICSTSAVEINAFISRIPLQKGASLEITLFGRSAGLTEVLFGISATHLSSLQSPTSMEYHPDRGEVQLLGPNGSFVFSWSPDRMAPFAEFPLLQLANIKAFRLVRHALGPVEPHTNVPRITFPPRDLPHLETLAIEREIDVPHILSALFVDPSTSPSLKTLAFLECHLDGACMEALAKFASDRQDTSSAWLYHVVIVSSGQNLPSFASIDVLGRYVPVVDVQLGSTLPADLF